MPKQLKAPKSIEERMQDCETHLSFLWEARECYRNDRERYKQVAGELRVLVCRFGSNKPLLLDMMDHFGFVYEVQPPGPPFERQPIPLVGWRDDPVVQELTKALEEAFGDVEKLAAVLARQATLRMALPLRRYVDDGLAVFIRPYDYSFSNLTRAIAEQSGVAHEDEGIEEGVAAMHQITIGNDHSHIVALINFGDTILQAGMEFLAFMVASRGYSLRRFQLSPV
ncbi:MAG TPA: hypothetical protein VK479_06420 [Micropepsaceae bacterium]|nr:hypothetical protein [Micropepsaceae bacterium]